MILAWQSLFLNEANNKDVDSKAECDQLNLADETKTKNASAHLENFVKTVLNWKESKKFRRLDYCYPARITAD